MSALRTRGVLHAQDGVIRQKADPQAPEQAASVDQALPVLGTKDGRLEQQHRRALGNGPHRDQDWHGEDQGLWELREGTRLAQSRGQSELGRE